MFNVEYTMVFSDLFNLFIIGFIANKCFLILLVSITIPYALSFHLIQVINNFQNFLVNVFYSRKGMYGIHSHMEGNKNSYQLEGNYIK